MTEKSNTTPETLLAEVIKAVEQEDARLHRRAIRSLLSGGPLLHTGPLTSERGALVDQLPAEDVSVLRAELLQLLRSLVRDQRSSEVSLLAPVSFGLAGIRGRVQATAQGRARDVAILQLIMLLYDVGFSRVRICAAPDCPRLFVKAYRREYCSVACQKRHYMRLQRQQEREQEERAARRRRRGV